MEQVIPELIAWAIGQGPAWVFLLGALAGWYLHAKDARTRETALNEKLLEAYSDNLTRTFEAISALREAMIQINRSGRL